MSLKTTLLQFLSVGFISCTLAPAAQIKVTITNRAPANGTFLTPVWVGFHDGSFDLYDPGAAVSPAFERLAEDGDNAPLMAAFTASGKGNAQATVGGGPIAPGTSVSFLFDLDGSSAKSRYFSYASMVIPSNDAFVANGNPMAFPIFSAGGIFQPADFTVLGSMVNDAGSEVNDERPMNTAFFGQVIANTGVVQNGVVAIHPGFLPKGSGGILDSAMFAGADFKAPGYQIARIQVEQVPEPTTILLSLTGLLALVGLSRRYRTNV